VWEWPKIFAGDEILTGASSIASFTTATSSTPTAAATGCVNSTGCSPSSPTPHPPRQEESRPRTDSPTCVRLDVSRLRKSGCPWSNGSLDRPDHEGSCACAAVPPGDLGRPAGVGSPALDRSTHQHTGRSLKWTSDTCDM
jgi:hypothetical protein